MFHVGATSATRHGLTVENGSGGSHHEVRFYQRGYSHLKDDQKWRKPEKASIPPQHLERDGIWDINKVKAVKRQPLVATNTARNEKYSTCSRKHHFDETRRRRRRRRRRWRRNIRTTRWRRKMIRPLSSTRRSYRPPTLCTSSVGTVENNTERVKFSLLLSINLILLPAIYVEGVFHSFCSRVLKRGKLEKKKKSLRESHRVVESWRSSHHA